MGDRLSRDRRVWRSTVVLCLGAALVLAAAPLTAGDRPAAPAASDPVASSWTPPPPVIGPAFSTLLAEAPGGGPASWRVSDGALPLSFSVERQVADPLGIDRITSGLGAWNAIPGSTFSTEVSEVVDDGLRDRRRDGVSRVFLAPDTCAGQYLARAHIWPAATEVRGRLRTVYVTEVDIGVCGTLDRDRAHLALRHEVAHAAGLGHLCEPDDDCWEPAMGSGHGCRVMYKRARACVRVEQDDLEGFRHLYPAVPRLGGHDGSATSVEASRHLFPTRRTAVTVILLGEAAEPELAFAAAAAAGAVGAPLLFVGETCMGAEVLDELNRVAELDATVLVGRLSGDCLRTLYGWELRTIEIGDPASLAEWVLGHTRRREVRLATRDLLEAQPALLASIAAAAGRDHVPLVFTSAAGVDRDVATLPGEGITRIEAFVTPSSAAVVPQVRRLVPTTSETVDAGTPHRLAARAAARRVVLTGTGWREAAVAAAFAGANGWPLLPVDGAMDESTVDALRDAGNGVVVAGEGTFPAELQREASMVVDASR